jgi:multiple sugar transport system permease protein
VIESPAGSPGNSTMFFVTYYYQQAFTDLHLGYASAMAFLLFILVLIITVVLLKTSRRWVYYENEQR